MDKLIKKDENQPYRYDWENLEVGDIVFNECASGMGSGGWGFGYGERVVEITDTEIITDANKHSCNRWDREKKHALMEPWAYELMAFQKGEPKESDLLANRPVKKVEPTTSDDYQNIWWNYVARWGR